MTAWFYDRREQTQVRYHGGYRVVFYTHHDPSGRSERRIAIYGKRRKLDILEEDWKFARRANGSSDAAAVALMGEETA